MKINAEQQGKKVFYGWWIVVVSSIGLFFCAGPVMGHTFGVFFNSLKQEFNWSRSEISLAFSISLLIMTVAMPLTGRLIDRVGARKVIIPAVIIFGLCLMSLYFLTGNLLHLYATFAGIGVVGGGTASLPYFRVITQWFDKRRGLTMGLLMGGHGTGSIVMPVLAHALIVSFGWRMAYVVIGLIVIVVTIPLVVFFLKENPQMLGLLPDGEVQTQTKVEHRGEKLGVSTREALRTGTFWRLTGAIFLVAASLMGCLIHLAPMLTDRGISAQSAAFAISILGGAIVMGRVGTGYLLDRYPASYVAFCLFSVAGLGILLLWSGSSGSLAFVAALLIGVGLGAEGDIIAYVVSRYFGLRAFGEIYGYALASFTLGATAGPLLMGINFDLTGSYQLILGAFFAATLISAGLMSRLGPYRQFSTEPTIMAAASLSSK